MQGVGPPDISILLRKGGKKPLWIWRSAYSRVPQSDAVLLAPFFLPPTSVPTDEDISVTGAGAGLRTSFTDNLQAASWAVL